MSTEYDERVSDYWRLPNRYYIMKLKQDDGLECETDLKNTMPAHLGGFNLSNNKRIMNNSIRDNDRLQTSNVYYTDMDSFYMAKKHLDVLDKTKLVGEKFCQSENHY